LAWPMPRKCSRPLASVKTDSSVAPPICKAWWAVWQRG
jgi:hypothetical protein